MKSVILLDIFNALIDRGWNWGGCSSIEVPTLCLVDIYYPNGDKQTLNIETIIFSHSFAKAFWGSGLKETYKDKLKEMVALDEFERIDFLIDEFQK